MALELMVAEPPLGSCMVTGVAAAVNLGIELVRMFSYSELCSVTMLALTPQMAFIPVSLVAASSCDGWLKCRFKLSMTACAFASHCDFHKAQPFMQPVLQPCATLPYYKGLSRL